MQLAWQMHAPGFLDTGAGGALLATHQGPSALVSSGGAATETLETRGSMDTVGCLFCFCFSKCRDKSSHSGSIRNLACSELSCTSPEELSVWHGPVGGLLFAF